MRVTKHITNTNEIKRTLNYHVDSLAICMYLRQRGISGILNFTPPSNALVLCLPAQSAVGVISPSRGAIILLIESEITSTPLLATCSIVVLHLSQDGWVVAGMGCDITCIHTLHYTHACMQTCITYMHAWMRTIPGALKHGRPTQTTTRSWRAKTLTH